MTAAAATTLSTVPIYPMSREEAEEALRRRPMNPILRTCSYTPAHPRVCAITYRALDESTGTVRIFHTLLELDPSGTVYVAAVGHGGNIERTTITYSSIEQLTLGVQREQRRLLLHNESLPAAAEHSSDLDVEETIMTG
jgi:hypothetical protein